MVDKNRKLVYYLTIALIHTRSDDPGRDDMEYSAGTPIYLQVIRELQKKMIKGELKPGDKMPSNRELAVLYKVNQNTAARIYREMESEGYCYTKRGIGTFVSEEESMFENLKKEMADEVLHNFMREMKDLGFKKDDIIVRITDNFSESQWMRFQPKLDN